MAGPLKRTARFLQLTLNQETSSKKQQLCSDLANRAHLTQCCCQEILLNSVLLCLVFLPKLSPIVRGCICPMFAPYVKVHFCPAWPYSCSVPEIIAGSKNTTKYTDDIYLKTFYLFVLSERNSRFTFRLTLDLQFPRLSFLSAGIAD